MTDDSTVPDPQDQLAKLLARRFFARLRKAVIESSRFVAGLHSDSTAEQLLAGNDELKQAVLDSAVVRVVHDRLGLPPPNAHRREGDE